MITLIGFIPLTPALAINYFPYEQLKYYLTIHTFDLAAVRRLSYLRYLIAAGAQLPFESAPAYVVYNMLPPANDIFTSYASFIIISTYYL